VLQQDLTTTRNNSDVDVRERLMFKAVFNKIPMPLKHRLEGISCCDVVFIKLKQCIQHGTWESQPDIENLATKPQNLVCMHAQCIS